MASKRKLRGNEDPTTTSGIRWKLVVVKGARSWEEAKKKMRARKESLKRDREALEVLN